MRPTAVLRKLPSLTTKTFIRDSPNAGGRSVAGASGRTRAKRNGRQRCTIRAVVGDVPLQSIVDLLRALVRIPSRADEDDLDRVCLHLEGWFRDRHVPVRLLTSTSGQRLGVYVEAVGETRGGPWTVLNATLDTAGFGDAAAWTFEPTRAEIDDGWIYGRGSADSKAAVSLFSHLILEFLAQSDFAGRIGVLFDCDEHSGRFGGARAFFDQVDREDRLPRPDGVVIGYPGMDRIVNGCRGFLRCALTVHGIAAHSGSSQHRGISAISRAVDLSRQLESLPLPPRTDAFPLPAQFTVTGIQGGGQSFSQVPDLCEVRLDVRLTPSFSLDTARRTIEETVARLDAASPQAAATAFDWYGGWPAYQLPPTHPLVLALREGSHDELGVYLPTAVVGPSNIGNYLASLGVPALCGFGVKEEGIHAANERVALESIEPVYRVYRNALSRLHRP
jgi:succinyl-diaminopimelate desuccinylase